MHWQTGRKPSQAWLNVPNHRIIICTVFNFKWASKIYCLIHLWTTIVKETNKLYSGLPGRMERSLPLSDCNSFFNVRNATVWLLPITSFRFFTKTKQRRTNESACQTRFVQLIYYSFSLCWHFCLGFSCNLKIRTKLATIGLLSYYHLPIRCW